jgi:hypothetical protein
MNIARIFACAKWIWWSRNNHYANGRCDGIYSFNEAEIVYTSSIPGSIIAS